MDTALLSQAAALLTQVLTHQLPFPCSLEQIEQLAHQQAQLIARQAVEAHAQSGVAKAEAEPPLCSCGTRQRAKQRRTRSLLVLSGLIRLRLRRYRCPACGSWAAPGERALSLRPRQRMTRRVEELLCRFGLSWSFALAARLVAEVLPGIEVSAKTVERSTKRCATAVAAQEEAQAKAAEAGAPDPMRVDRPLANPRRVYLGLDGVLVRGRAEKQRWEVQVGSLWSECREIPGRKHERREITDATVVARALGWEELGRQVWRMFVERGGAALPEAEIVVLGDGAQGIRSVWELHFSEALAILDPWHLWEKVKERSQQVLGRGKQAREACLEVYGELKVGAVGTAMEWVRGWKAKTEKGAKAQERLISYLERNREIIRDCERLREEGYQVGSGLTEKANDLVVVPRMKNGKMHWSRSGADGVAMLRACLINEPGRAFLPS